MDFDLYTIVYLIAGLFNLIIVHRFMEAFFDERATKIPVFLLSYAFYFISTSTAYLVWDIPIITMIVNLIAIFVIAYNYRSPVRKKIFVTFFFYIFMFITEIVLCAVTDYFSFPIFNKGYYSNVTGIIIMRIVAYIEALVFYNIKTLKKNETVNIPQWIATIFIPLATLTLKVFIIDSESATKLQVVLSTLILFFVNLITFFLYNSLAKSYSKEKEAAIVSKEKEMYYNQCNLMKETSEHLQKFRHDINNQFISIKELMSKGMYDELYCYIESLTKKLEIDRIFSNTGNIIVDSIINYKLNMLTNSSIETEIAVPPLLNVDVNDLVIILGNILDNAIEALNNSNQESKLYFKVVYSQGRLIIKETNTYNTKICYENGEIQSSKTDKSNHGLGLKSIEEAVKRNEGYMEINHNDNAFSIDIILFV